MNFKTTRFKPIAMAAVALLFVVTGCSDFLTETNKSSLTQENYYQNASQVRSAVAGLYEDLRTFTNSTGYGEAVWVSLDLLVGHANTNGQSDRNREFINHEAGTDHPVFSNVWDNFYNGVANTNVAIANIPNVDMDQSEKDKLLGEAYFLRAFYYYHLVRLYGEIPLITEPVKSGSDENLYANETSVDSISTQIVSDLQIAEEAGLPATTTSGRVSQGAVKSLLASVYLTMAGYPLEKGNEYYQKAADKAEEVIDAGWYRLFDDYTFLHDRDHKNQDEFILQSQYKGGIATNGITALAIPENEGISTFGDEFGSIRPVDEFVQTYEEGDKRVEEKEFYFTQYTLPDGTVKEFGEYALWKYWLDASANPETGDQQGDINWTLLRLPEVMLIYAEAINEVNGPTAKAYDQVNAIRERADLDPISGLSRDEFREAVWKERYHELNYENKAYFDIQRTHMVYDLENNTFVNAFTHQNVQGVTFSEKYLLWAIPSGEMQTNPNLTQNRGWATENGE